jgi:uroporphyrinogen decarboxylase
MSASESRFLRACRRLPVDRTPVWFMRQAGRYMPAYRQLRKKYDLLAICRTPELAAEVTLQPIEAFDLDAAIIFADILLPLVPMGLDLRFAKGVGPQIANPVRSIDDLHHLSDFDPALELAPTLEAIRLVRTGLPDSTPLIGFAGGPFTLACYMIEGGGSRHFERAKGLMYSQPALWSTLMERVTGMTQAYLLAQIEAGAQAVQLFDSWAGALSPDDYRRFAQPYSQRVLQAVAETSAPSLHFGTNTASLLERMAEAGGDVIGIDWRIDLDQAWEIIGYDRAIQGNLDPCLLFGGEDEIRAQTRRILARAAGRPGHIFNLGHGILPRTPMSAVRLVVDTVHSYQPIAATAHD